MNKNDIIINYIDELILSLRKLGINIPYIKIREVKNRFLNRSEPIDELKEELDKLYYDYLEKNKKEEKDYSKLVKNNQIISNKLSSFMGESYKTSLLGLFDIYEKVINDNTIVDKDKKFIELRDLYLTQEVKRLDSFAEAQSNDPHKVKSVKTDMFMGYETLTFDVVSKLYNTFIDDITLVVPQNEGKMNYIIDNTKKVFNSDGSINQDIYNFNDLKKVFDFSKSHKKELKLHTLIWHKSIPENLQSEVENLPLDQQRGALLTFINNYFYNISKFIKDNNYKLRQIDVLNEIVSDDDSKDLLRNSFFKRILGNNPENGDNYYIDILKLARNYFPDTEFIYNDYNEFNPKKADRICTVIKDIEDKSIRDGISYIDGLGLQTHLAPYTSASKNNRCEVTPELIYETMNKYNNLRVPLYRTEIDAMEFTDKARLNNLFEAIKECDKSSNIFGICLYGNSEALGWRNSSKDGHFINKDGTPKEIFKFYKELIVTRAPKKKDLKEEKYINSLFDLGISKLDVDTSVDKIVENQAKTFDEASKEATEAEKSAISKGKEYFSTAVTLGFTNKNEILEASKAITTMNLSSDQSSIDTAREKLNELRNKDELKEEPKVMKKSNKGSTTALFIALNIGIIGSCIATILYIINNFA